jgi:hypothetical protein
MMSTLQLRGFSFTGRRPTSTLTPIGAADITLLGAALVLYAVVALARFTSLFAG